MLDISTYPEHPINLKFVRLPRYTCKGWHETIAITVAVVRTRGVHETRRREAIAVVRGTVILVGTGKILGPNPVGLILGDRCGQPVGGHSLEPG
jgi:hypothetical protein